VRLYDRDDGDQDRVHAGHHHDPAVATVDHAHRGDQHHDVDDNDGARVI